VKRLLVLMLAVFAGACGSSSPTAPTATATPPAAATPATFSLSGTVTSSTTGAAISGATVRIVDGANAGKSTSSASSGAYSFSGLAVAGQTVSASATNFVSLSKGVSTTSNQTLDFQLTPTPLFTASGVGDSVFTIPSTVSRIRIQATPGSSCQNFVVRIAGSLVVNVILGTCSVADARTHDGTYLTSGGTVQVTISSGVSWIFTEVRP
jgi:hypothetical protein